MSNDGLGIVVRHLHRLAGRAEGDESTDGQLLAQFLSRHDEEAFTTLVRRHGPMVWGACRRVLGDEHAAEDAFQATFLVLLRRARSLRAESKSLAGWLYTVA